MDNAEAGAGAGVGCGCGSGLETEAGFRAERGECVYCGEVGKVLEVWTLIDLALGTPAVELPVVLEIVLLLPREGLAGLTEFFGVLLPAVAVDLRGMTLEDDAIGVVTGCW